jgi:hypothetical protein
MFSVLSQMPKFKISPSMYKTEGSGITQNNGNVPWSFDFDHGVLGKTGISNKEHVVIH